ncbi:MAG: helix-turn-helix domain-containing protein [Lachnospiraceae bacterium]|nr:helix-turn-helix domain-containing protein [Lachnospiraceae bacterium]
MSYTKFARSFFSAYTKSLRSHRKLTQEEMSEQLHISWRSYSDLERGKSGFSAKSLLFLMLMLNQEEAMALLAEARVQLQELIETDDL